MLALGQHADQPLVTGVAAWLYRLVPDLESFNLTIQAVHGLEIAPGEILWPMLYGVGYTAILLMAASYVFQRRDLK
jgi:hypothetical protein